MDKELQEKLTKLNFSKEELAKIEEACKFAVKAHDGQKRLRSEEHTSELKSLILI